MSHLFSSALSFFLLASPASPSPCSAPGYRQFDFWIGDWDVYDTGDAKPSMHIRVERILDGCALRESYTDVNGMIGESLNVYDAARKTWQQTWATNRGQVLLLEGKLEGEKMVFRATEQTASGPLLWRAAWIPQGAEVRETAETSSDGGKTWKPKFDIIFRKRP